MPQQSHSMLKSKHLEHSSEESEIELFSYIDLLNYMLKYKIPQIVTLTPIDARRGCYEGMLDERKFTVRMPDGSEKTVLYKGKKINVKF